MKVHRYTEQQRRQWVYEMQHKLKSVKTICNEAVISRATLYNWLKEFANDIKNGKPNNPETASPVAWQPLDKHKMLIAALCKTDKDKTIGRKLVSELIKRYTLTVAQACEIAGVDAAIYNYKPRKPEAEDRLVYDELLRLIAADTNRGLDDCTAHLQQTQPGWTSKQIKRIYRQGRLYLKRTRARTTKLLNAINPQATAVANSATRILRKGAFWQAGIIEGTLGEKERFWLLYIIDYNDGTPLNAMVCEEAITAGNLINFLSLAATENGVPKKMRVMAQPLFNSREAARWIWDNKVTLYKLSAAKQENQLEIGHLEDSIKNLLLEANMTIDDLKEKAEEWIRSFAANTVIVDAMEVVVNE